MGTRSTGGHVRNLNGRIYRLVYDGPTQRLEHRVVAEEDLGRPLEGPGEIVHHHDDDGLNNDPRNLSPMDAGEHARLHAQQRRYRTGARVKTIVIDVAISMRKSGASLAAIGRHFDVTYQAVAAAFKKRGIETGNLAWGKHKWPIEEAIDLYESGTRLCDLAKRYGTGAPTIRRALILRGIYRPVHRPLPQRAIALLNR